jgi:hypothetical protein
VKMIAATLGFEAEQIVDLRLDWSGIVDLRIEFRIGGAPINSGGVEVLATTNGITDVVRRELVDGAITATFVAERVLLFAVRPTGEAWFVSDPFAVTADTPRVLRVDFSATSVITGRVEDEHGAPITNAAVYFGWSKEKKNLVMRGRAIAPSCDFDKSRFRTVTAGDGTFILPPAQVDGHELIVIAKGFETIRIPVTEELARRIPLRLPLERPRNR